MQAQILVLPVLRLGLGLLHQLVVGGSLFGLGLEHFLGLRDRIGCGGIRLGGGAALLGGAFLLHVGRFVLDGNLGALILRCALRLGRALHRHGAYFPSLSSTTS